ncbi:hypothetical protein NHF46_06880 [Arthrobacter alpinus]|nr:hypothetical protein [Arthrobacter alpinus]
MMVILLIIAGRLVLVQGLDVGNMAQAAENQRKVVQTLPAVRGKIVDVKGKVLAESIIRYNITVSQINFAQYPEFKRVDIDPKTGEGLIDPATGQWKVETFTSDEGIEQLAQLLKLPFDDVKKSVTGDKVHNFVAMDVSPKLSSKSPRCEFLESTPRLSPSASTPWELWVAPSWDSWTNRARHWLALSRPWMRN